MTDWPVVHAKVVEEFRRGWDQPDPHAWDRFFDESTRFVQPMLRDGVGPAHWWNESRHVLTLLPDLRADVLSWAGTGENLYIHIRFSATLAGEPMTWEAVDLLRVTSEGLAVFRESFFDTAPLAAQIARRPRAWLRWWRSGVGPFFARRRLLRPIPAAALAAGSWRSRGSVRRRSAR